MSGQAETKADEDGLKALNRRLKSRISMLLMATVRFEGMTAPVSARVIDLSSGGVRIAAKFSVHRGHRLRIALKGVGELGGRVAWSGRGAMGIQFDSEIDTRLIVRALTGLPPSTHIAFAKGFVPRPGFKVR